MLTQRQHDLLVFINERIRESGVPPSYREMGAGIGVRSSATVQRLVDCLEDRGFVRKLPERWRALEVIRMPEDYRSGKPQEPRRATAGRIPIMGRIGAGLPLSAIQTATGSISLPGKMDGDFALEMHGDSMVDAGILDGDIVVLKKRASLMQGDVVLAVIDEVEATLKRYRSKGASVALEAAHPAYETRIFAANRVRIQGRMVGLMRRY